MASRYRPPSPVGRRYLPPERSSTSSFYKPELAPPANNSRRHRESFTSPRSSAERVIPISSETYVNGAPVASRPNRYDTYDDRRRSTLDAYEVPRSSVSSSTASSSLRPAVVHHDRGVSPVPRQSRYDGEYYLTPASSAPRREHKKVYSIDDGQPARLVGGTDRALAKRGEPEPPPRVSGRNDYRSIAADRYDRLADIEDDGSYEYTDPRGMFRDTEPKVRTRRGSVDAASRRERPSSLVEPYGSKAGLRDLGPPPTTRGLDRINGPSRHDSLSGISGTRPREKSYGSIYSEDENYRVAPRVSSRRPESMYYDRRDAFSPARDSYDDRPEPRRLRRYEDPDVATRGFGVRAPSIDDHDRRSESIDSRTAYRNDNPNMVMRRDYPPEHSSRDEVRSDIDRRETERLGRYEDPVFSREKAAAREKDKDGMRERDLLKEKDKEPGRERDRDLLREKEASKEKDRDPRVDRDAMRDRDHEYDEERRMRDRDRLRSDREYDKHSDEERRPRDKRKDYDPDPERRERHEEKKWEDNNHSSSVPGALAGTAAAGALALGANEMIHRRDRDRAEPPDEHNDTPREDLKSDDSLKEMRQRDDIAPEERSRETTRADVRESTVREDESPDADRIRTRNYVSKEDPLLAEPREVRQKSPEFTDPEEDYRRRIQQEVERVKGTKDEDPSESDRERRRRDRERHHQEDHTTPRESGHEALDESKALTPYEPRREDSHDEPTSDGATETSESIREKRVAIVEPPKEKERPKSILRKPTEKFPEDPNPVREGVAPLSKDGKNKNIPPGARWTKIDRRLVNPESLEQGQERFEERKDHVIVLRVLTKDEIQKYADKTKEIRDARYEYEHRGSRHHHHHGRDRHGSRRDYDDNDDSKDSDGEQIQRQLTWDR